MLRWLGLAGLFYGLLISSNDTQAFGAQGHEAVCEIAYLELSDQARSVVDRLQQSTNDYPSFGEACVWPDTRGRLQNARRSSHFVNVLRSLPIIALQRCSANQACIFSAISEDLAELTDTTLSDATRWSALKFLGHWYGDLHQPLHVSYADDRGGNLIAVSKDMGCERNLHSVWDECIVKDLMKTLKADDQPGLLGQRLQQSISEKQRIVWQLSASPLAIANESYTIAQTASVQYCFKVNGICQYGPKQEIYSSNRYLDNSKKRTVNVNNAYLKQFHGTIELRIQQAGIRLAYVLNQALATDSISK